MRTTTAGPIPAEDEPHIEAVVPGAVHLDLMRAGMIADPALSPNDLAARWIEQCVWWLRRDFEAPPRDTFTHAWLECEQLDLNARVFLNGGLVGSHQNAFRPLRVDVTDALLEGTNHIAIELDSGMFDSETEYAFYLGLPARTNAPLDRRHLRKPQYQFGWDFTPRCLNVGCGDIRLGVSTASFIAQQVVPVVDVAPNLASATVRARVVIESFTGAPESVRLRAVIGSASSEREIKLSPGEKVYEIVLGVLSPELWWPAGRGPQTMHRLTVEVVSDGDRQELSADIGFRRVEIRQDELEDGGRTFVVLVNNEPVFCKGTNLAPLDMIPARVTRERWESLIALTREANMNFLRVNGTGLYESADLYDLCDREGILVWQDFTFSCAQYPATDPTFLAEIREEARHQIRRLAAHPSLVVWCGGNECEWHSWDHQADRPSDLPDYHLYHLVLPQLLSDEDPSRSYVSSSPHSPDASFPNSDGIGDQHPWSVGMGDASRLFGGDDPWDIRAFREMTCRFPDEGGILGPTAWPTLSACVEPSAIGQRDLNWCLHADAFASLRLRSAEQMLYELTGLDARRLSVEQYAYWGGLVQAEGLREYVENFRRRMFDSAAACTWSLNDCRPSTMSWSIVDYYQRRMPGFWAMKRSMAPVHVAVCLDGDAVRVFGINDTPAEVSCEISAGFFRSSGRSGADESAGGAVSLPPNASTELFTLGSWSGDPKQSIAYAVLRRPGHLDARSRLILPTFRDLAWDEPMLEVRVENGDAVFSSDTFVWGVCLDLSGEHALADNFFDVWPGMEYRLPGFDSPPEVLQIGNLTSGRRTGR
jgi:beta-mannosidase